MPRTAIGAGARRTRSGRHGRACGWKPHLAVTVAAVWRPLAAALAPADAADNVRTLALLDALSAGVRSVLGDGHY